MYKLIFMNCLLNIMIYNRFPYLPFPLIFYLSKYINLHFHVRQEQNIFTEPLKSEQIAASCAFFFRLQLAFGLFAL
jgi:hypothetical protein